jgi:hypothetical protein
MLEQAAVEGVRAACSSQIGSSACNSVLWSRILLIEVAWEVAVSGVTHMRGV